MAISRPIWVEACMLTGDNSTEVWAQKFGGPSGLVDAFNQPVGLRMIRCHMNRMDMDIQLISVSNIDVN